MLAEVKRDEFRTMDDEALIWRCIEPAIVPIRGRSFGVKNEVYGQLNAGQRALLMFQVFLGHISGGAAEFLGSMSYLLSRPGFWSELKKGMECFHCPGLAGLIAEMEAAYGTTEGNDNIPEQIISGFDRRMAELLPPAITLVAAALRSHPGDYVNFTD